MSVLEQIFLRYINFIDLLYTVQIHWRWAYKRKSRVSSTESSPFMLGAEWRGTSCFCSVCRKDVFFGQVAFQWSNNDNVGLYIVCTDRLASARRKTPRRRWSRPLLSVAWTTVSVTRCATASLTNWRAACSQFRTLPPGSWRAPGDAFIFRLCSASCCNGFLCGSVSCSRLRLPILVRQRPGLPGWRLSARRRRPCQTTAFCRHSNIRCQSDAQQFWRQNLCHRRIASLEQSAAQSQTM